MRWQCKGLALDLVRTGPSPSPATWLGNFSFLNDSNEDDEDNREGGEGEGGEGEENVSLLG